MILTDYFRSQRDLTWDYAGQCGVEYGVIRLPEEDSFDITDRAHWQRVYDGFVAFGIKPMVIEPLPNELHDHIKAGDELRDECIDKFITMLKYMDELDIRIVCLNFMAHIGWLRTETDIEERGGALVTGFSVENAPLDTPYITEEQLWGNFRYFIRRVMPYAEKYNVKLALHPDDPPIPKIGNTSRIFINYENIKKAIAIADSPNFGVTMCQATYYMMGEDVEQVVRDLGDKIFFIHFRNTRGEKHHFRETFHDNGDLDMAAMLRLYIELGLNVPIRVDHVPQMAGESDNTGYTALGRLYAIGYLKGLLEAIEKEPLR